MRRQWLLDPEVLFLNHGSFGACPRQVLDFQAGLRERMEREPVLFLGRELEALADTARLELAAFLGADPEGLAFVPNATAGVNTALAACRLAPGDELLVTDHEYNACRNALEAVAQRTGSCVVTVRVPFPCAGPAVVLKAVRSAVTPRTRVLLIDHVTSPTALVLPVEPLVRELADLGVDVIVDGAHGPGQVPIRLDAMAPAFYTGNCHKWLCAPKGAAFLWVREDRREGTRPLVISHGENHAGTGRSRFRSEFDWTGTADPTPFLAIPEAIRFLSSLFPGGMAELQARNRQLALEARVLLADALGLSLPCPDEMVGSMATLVLPGPPLSEGEPPGLGDRLQDALWDRQRIEVPVIRWR
ncbi:MAG: aminotransferase class V-fold PLP-dependent enzyme, partial [Deltaproteobacteria bacterium]|nr:aminotransferase class V-fold PLP-dependent enzyme [Deltaproteobacteria bacterium]